MDIVLNLHNDSCFSFHKTSANLKYVSNFSNPPNYRYINVYLTISLRISYLSANVDIFNDKAGFLKSALLRADYKLRVLYTTILILILLILVKTWKLPLKLTTSKWILFKQWPFLYSIRKITIPSFSALLKTLDSFNIVARATWPILVKPSR